MEEVLRCPGAVAAVNPLEVGYGVDHQLARTICQGIQSTDHVIFCRRVDSYGEGGGMMNNSPFLTLPEVCELLRVPASWVYVQVRQGRMPHLKPGKRLLFVREDVLAWFRREFERPASAPSRTRLRPRGRRLRALAAVGD